MTDTPDRKALALFRYGLIADLIHLPAGSRGLYARLREKAAADYTIPGSSASGRRHETLRDWLRRVGAAASTHSCPRAAPIGAATRALPQSVADALLSLKDDQPHLSLTPLISARRRLGHR